MKNFTIIFLFTLSAFTSAQDKGTMDFKSTIYDFGQVASGDKVQAVFTFTNNGKKSVKILNIQSTGDCISSEKTEKEIAVGESGQIKLTYDTNCEGPIRSTVTVFSDAENSAQALKLRGRVLPKS
ncbi:DUF1573 domain-containing protein [Psychroflexus aestuariivivens]|uniref:DUF1573 domain-containing protein n=1 Tax=Psychroflexus aestuariivivens TaxID=1795040 RepID=UPI000FDCA8BC|nr:DUF1573 domain-containing protein [Psychroflexus aestuariivivens]